MKKIEVMAKTVESAIEKGLTELGLTKEQADITVVNEGGFLKQCRVLVSQKKSLAETAAEFTEGLLEKMNLTCVVEAEEDDEEIRLELIGTDTGSIIGYRGEVLDSIQYLASSVANKGKEKFKRVIIDTEDYRAKRILALEQLAKNLESKVVRTKKPARLEPMNSFERRIIHATLQNSTDVVTASEGTPPARFVVISLKNAPHTKQSDGKNNNGKKSHTFIYRSEKKKRR